MSAQPTKDKLHAVSIDYITATSHCPYSSGPLGAFAEWMVSEEVSRGCKNRDYSANGYHGRIAGGTAVGYSQQGTIVRASSECASTHWQQLLTLADNITRLDLAVTVLPSGGPTRRLSEHHKQLLKAPRYKGKPGRFKVWYGPSGPESCIIGRRLSDRFGRAYDKGLESGLPEWANTLRYELELHRFVAFSAAKHLDSLPQPEPQIISMVSKFMTVRGLRMPVLDRVDTGDPLLNVTVRDWKPLTPVNRSVPEVTRALRWMTDSVRPSIERLINAGYQKEVYNALGLNGPIGPTPLQLSETWTDFAKWR